MQVQKLPRGIYMLLLLSAKRGEAINNRTRLAKLMFLITKEVLEKSGRRITPKSYTFRADRYGPFSEEVYDDVETLRDLKLVTWENEEILEITDKGKELVNRLIGSNKIPSNLIEEIEDLKRKFNQIPLKQLLRYVYEKYDKYTVESEIRDEVLGYRY